MLRMYEVVLISQQIFSKATKLIASYHRIFCTISIMSKISITLHTIYIYMMYLIYGVGTSGLQTFNLNIGILYKEEKMVLLKQLIPRGLISFI